MLVGADPALEGDRHDLVGQLDEVHPGVVVVDDPARLLDDGPADRLDRRGAVQAAGGGLQDRELRGARLGLLEELGVVSAMPACVARVVRNAMSPSVQSRGSRVTADSAPITRSWWMSGAMRSPANARMPS